MYLLIFIFNNPEAENIVKIDRFINQLSFFSFNRLQDQAQVMVVHILTPFPLSMTPMCDFGMQRQ